MNPNHITIFRALLPFAFLYGIGVRFRNMLFDRGILQSKRFKTPVICVGNLTVGGTGKTPHTEYLIRLLQPQFKVAVLSRGYKRKSKGFVLASPHTSMEDIGDEPYQMVHKYPNIYMAADKDRCHGIETLENTPETSDTEAIILDDAFQHRYVKAGLNILLTDYNRPVYADKLLPAGRLREPLSGKRRADIIIISKCPRDLTSEIRQQILSRINPISGQTVYFTTLGYDKLYSLFNPKTTIALEDLNDKEILLLTGIASPRLLLKELSCYSRHIHPLTFSDHHHFNKKDMECICQTFERLPQDKRIIITTEKDATRLVDHPFLSETLKPYFYVLPVKVEFLNDSEQSFNKQIIDYVKKNPRNI